MEEDKQILFRVTDEEKNRFQAAAEKMVGPDMRSVSMAAFLRAAAHAMADKLLGAADAA
jgi:hypothetical protein